MFVRGITLSIAAIFAVGLMAETADADHDRRKPRRIIIEDGYYPGPPIIREIPGLRILFGDYALSAEEFDELYGTPRRAYRYDEEPEPRKQKRKAREREKQKQQQKQKSKTAAKPAKPAELKKTASKTAAKTAAASTLSCEKATSVVTGYGFSSVTPSSCSGKVYAFNATRDGKSFAIKLDSANGELTEVKKLP
jgi:hypothetical protein